MDDKKVIVITLPDCMGGVSSFNRNIINFAKRDPRYRVRVILMKSEGDDRKRFEDPIIADEVLHFDYSFWENQLHVYRRLSRLLGQEPGCIVTDNWVTLNVIRQMGTPKAVIHLVHDFYYIGLAQEFHQSIDACIVHSPFFRDVLLAADVDAFENKAHYIPYGVEQPGDSFKRQDDPNGALRLVFLGRWTESKGVLLLKEIDDRMLKKGIRARWTILGSGPLEHKLKEQWKGEERAAFLTAKDTEEVYNLLARQDILVFPSKFEGTPVAIMEAMSRGVVPVVSDLPGGTKDMVTTDSGFRCPIGDADAFAEAIVQLDQDRARMKSMQDRCLERSKAQYDIRGAADNYFRFFIQMAETVIGGHQGRKKIKINGLDSPVLPNGLVYMIRKWKSKR